MILRSFCGEIRTKPDWMDLRETRSSGTGNNLNRQFLELCCKSKNMRLLGDVGSWDFFPFKMRGVQHVCIYLEMTQ